MAISKYLSRNPLNFQFNGSSQRDANAKDVEDNKPKIVMPKSVMLSTKVLEIDKEYQRLINHDMVRKIRDNFDPDLFQSLIVSERDERYFVVDGMHRLIAINDIVNEVPCILWQGLTYEEECAKFRKLNTNRKGLNASVVFHSMVCEGDSAALKVVEILAGNGFKYNRYNQTSKENMIGSPSRMMKIYNTNGAAALDRLLHISRRAWHGTKDSLMTSMLAGLNTFLSENSGIDDNILVEALSEVDPKIIKGRAAYYVTADTITGLNGGHSKQMHIANAIKELYNKKVPKKSRIM